MRVNLEPSVPPVERLITLVMEPEPITALDPPCPSCKARTLGDKGAARKTLFLNLSYAVLNALKVEMGYFGEVCPVTKQDYCSINPAGPLTSGDVTLDTGLERVVIYPRFPRWDIGDFQCNYREGWKNWKVGMWLKWEELRDMKKLAEQIKRGRPT